LLLIRNPPKPIDQTVWPVPILTFRAFQQQLVKEGVLTFRHGPHWLQTQPHAHPASVNDCNQAWTRGDAVDSPRRGTTRYSQIAVPLELVKLIRREELS